MVKRERVQIRVSDEIYSKLESMAALRGETVSEVSRKILWEGVDQNILESSSGKLSLEVRRAVDEALRPHINRLAAINAKTSITSGTAMYLNLETLNDLGKKDVVKTYERARQKAVAYLKTKESGEI